MARVPMVSVPSRGISFLTAQWQDEFDTWFEFPSPLRVISFLTTNSSWTHIITKCPFPSPLGVISSLTAASMNTAEALQELFPSPLGVISSLTIIGITIIKCLFAVSVPSRGYLFLNKKKEFVISLIPFPSPLGVISSLTGLHGEEG